MTSPLVIIVTGANKGIGFETVRKLATTVRTSFLAKELQIDNALIYLTARDESRGRKALAGLASSDPSDPRVKVEFAQLDVGDASSVEGFKKMIENRHESVHVLINNAGVAPSVGGDGGPFDSDIVNWVMNVNYWGVHRMTDTFLPLMRPKGRIVNVSSLLSNLSPVSAELAVRLKACKTVKEADILAKEWQDSVKEGTYAEKGWPTRAYSVSKILLNALTRGHAAELRPSRPGLLINWLEPGWVTTDMGPAASQGTAADGARSPTFLAIGDLKGKSGQGYDKDQNEKDWVAL